MADQMLTAVEAIKRGLAVDPFEFTEATHRVPEEARQFGQRYYESRWFFAIVTEIVTANDFDMTWISVRRNDRQHLSDWRALQRIKNALCGPEREAVQLHPAESRLMDAANQSHLWVLAEGEYFPWGYMKRDVLTATEAKALTDAGHAPDARQRPFDAATEAASRPLSDLDQNMQTEIMHRPKYPKETS